MATFNAGSIEASLDLDVDPFQRGIAWARAEGKKFAGETYTAKLDADTTLAARGANNARRSLERAEGRYRAKFEVDGLAEAMAEAAAFKRTVGGIGDQTVNVNTEQGTQNVTRMRRGIMALLPALAILSTGLVPLTAAAVPILGLASNLTLAAGAGGAAILAFQGVGDALKAANEAGAEPTAENLEKLRAAMAELTPEARQFISTFRDMGPAASDLQATAAAGFFPGVTRGLETTDLRDYIGLVHELADAGGDNLGGALEALNAPEWVRFFTFVRAEARPGIDDLAAAGGNLAGVFAELWQAFDPLNDDFGDWLVRSTAGLRDASAGLSGSDGMNRFIAYAREQGPEAAEALSALGGALVDIVVAAAPLGGVVLDVLQGVGEAISFIAEQPFGSTILTGAAALYTLNRTLAVTQGLMKRTGLGAAAAGGTTVAAGGGTLSTLGADVRSAITPLTAGERAGLKPGDIDRQTAAANRLRTAAVGAGAAVGAIALLSTGAGEALGVTNTAMLGLAGSMAGPWGAAAGATVGLLLDIHSASQSATEGIKAYQDATSNEFVSFSQTQAAGDTLAQSKPAPEFLRALSLGTSPEEAEAQTRAYEDAVTDAASRTDDLQLAAGVLAKRFDIVTPAFRNSALTAEQLDSALVKAQPAMAAMGISTDDLMAAARDGSILDLVDRIAAYQGRADSAAGRTSAFGKTVADLGNDAIATADSASALATALEALLGPQLNLEQATDDWHASLKALEKDLKAGAGFRGYSAAAIANRQATRDYTTDSIERLTALANVSTTTERDMAAAVRATRVEFIRSGVAAGVSRKAMIARANAMGLTPKLVRTVFEAAGIDQADLKARQLRENYKSLPKDVRTAIRTDGVPQTTAQVNALVKRYELTEKERRALISLQDAASGGIRNIIDLISNVRDKQVTVTTVMRTVHTGGGRYFKDVPAGADGYTVPKTGLPYADRHLMLLADGEEIVSNRYGQADRFRADRAAGRIPAYSGGGTTDWSAPRRGLSPRQAAAARMTSTSGTYGGMTAADVDRIVDAIEKNRGVYAEVSSKEDLNHAMRALEREGRRRS